MATKNTKSIKTPKIPEDYRPISMWGYFGYEILFSIPVIGWIFVIIFAITAPNHNLKNFARSQFCLWIIWLVLLCIVAFPGCLAGMLGYVEAAL